MRASEPGSRRTSRRRFPWGGRRLTGDNLGKRSRVGFGIGNDLQGAAFEKALDAACTPVGADEDVAPILVDLGPALERQLLVLLDTGNVERGVAAIPLFAKHDGILVEIAAHDGVDVGALVEAVHLDQPAFGQCVERGLQLGARAQVVPEKRVEGGKSDAADAVHHAAEQHDGLGILQGIVLDGKGTQRVRRNLVGVVDTEFTPAAQDARQFLPGEVDHQAESKTHAEWAAAGQGMQIVDVAEGSVADLHRRTLPDKLGNVGDVKAFQVDVLILDQVGDRRAEIAVDQQNARLALVLMQVADNRDQGVKFLQRATAQLVEDQQALALVELLEDADAPAVVADAGKGRAEDTVQRTHHVVKTERVGARGADANNAVAEMMEVIPGNGGSERALAHTLFAADGDGRQIVAAGQPVVQGEQLAAAAAKAFQAVKAKVMGRFGCFGQACRVQQLLHNHDCKTRHGNSLTVAISDCSAWAKNWPPLTPRMARAAAPASIRIRSGRTRRAS